jgi:hypothetical protein
MQGTYYELWEKAVSEDLRNTLQIALVDAAITVYAESDATPNHANRIALALQVVNSPETYARRMVWAIVKIATDATDASLKAAALTAWNAFAGM